MWLLVHIYFLSGFKNRLFVVIQWGWSYLTFARGSRLIVSREWRSYADEKATDTDTDLGVAVPHRAASPSLREAEDDVRHPRGSAIGSMA
jgi:hypothetical protein